MKREPSTPVIALTTRDLGDTARLIRGCYAISQRETERLLWRHSGDLNAALDELGESDDSPHYSQHDALRDELERSQQMRREQQ